MYRELPNKEVEGKFLDNKMQPIEETFPQIRSNLSINLPLDENDIETDPQLILEPTQQRSTGYSYNSNTINAVEPKYHFFLFTPTDFPSFSNLVVLRRNRHCLS